MCDTLLAAASETRDGHVVFAKNSDRKDGESQPFLQFPAASHPPGARVRCTHIAIPQVAETYAVMGHSPWWVWGFEHGVNEQRVAIGNLTVFSREPVEETPGLIGMDLVRLGLERGRTAREALEVIASLVETHGQGGAALAPDASGYHNAFALADPAGCWLLETSGRHWAAREVTLESHSNHLSLGDDWEIACSTLEAYARASGWWQRAERIDVARAYRNPHVPGVISEGRLRRARELLLRKSGRIDVAHMQASLRDHLEGGPTRQDGATPEDDAYYTLCMHSEPIGTTTASMVASLAEPAEAPGAPWPVWISFGTPCTGVFLPVYLGGVIPPAMAADEANGGGGSAWWAFKHLQDAAAVDFAGRTPELREAWRPFERELEEERVRVEAEAAEHAASEAEGAARACLSAFMQRTLETALERARELTIRYS